MKACAVTSSDGGLAEAVAIAKKDKRLGAKLGERKRPALGKFVLGRKRGQESFGE
jgi:hypothetical protein